ncbi:MAG: hypothetical protein GX914_00260 [Erysipelotrichia bacterium]|nr:hypothetical protein [Erysipelotrichia bacterium]
MLILFEMLGCQKQPTDADVISLSINCVSMVYTYSYYFKIHLEDGKTLFSCNCTIDKEKQNDTFVSCENVEIDNEYFNQLINILKANNVTKTVRKNRYKKDLFFIRDKTKYSISLGFENDKYLKAPIYFEDIYIFLKQLASLYAMEVTNE